MNRPQRVDGGWLWVGGPVPPRCTAVALGSLVVVRRSITASSEAEEVVRRERARAARIAEIGWTRYLGRYAKDYLGFRARGYSHGQAKVRVPLEVEARVDAHARRADSVDAVVAVETASAVRRTDAPSPMAVTPPALR